MLPFRLTADEHKSNIFDSVVGLETIEAAAPLMQPEVANETGESVCTNQNACYFLGAAICRVISCLCWNKQIS